MNRKNITSVYCLVQGAFWCAMCAASTFAAVYLGSIGYSNTELGRIIALGALVGFFLPTLISPAIDRSPRINASMAALLFQGLSVILGLTIFSISQKGILLDILYICWLGVMLTTSPMMIQISLDYIHEGWYISYGAARAFGSLMFVGMSYGLGKLLETIPKTTLPMFGALMSFLMMAMVLVLYFVSGKKEFSKNIPSAADDVPARLRDSDRGQVTMEAGKCRENQNSNLGTPGRERCSTDAGKHRESPDAEQHCKSPGAEQNRKSPGAEQNRKSPGSSLGAFLKENQDFALLLIAIGMIFSACEFFGVYMISIVENVGGTSTDMGSILAVSAALEIPGMMLWGKIGSRSYAERLLIMSLFCFSARLLTCGLATSLAPMYLSGIFQMLGYGIYTPAIVDYIRKNIPYKDSVKAQSLVVAMNTFGLIFASLVGGILVDNIGVQKTLFLLTGLCIAGSIVGTVAILRHRKKSVIRNCN